MKKKNPNEFYNKHVTHSFLVVHLRFENQFETE